MADRSNYLKYPIYVPITYSSGNNSIIQPARCQVVWKIEINSAENSVLIPIQEIQHGTYFASTRATVQNAFIRLLNTTNIDHVVNISNFKCESLSNYDVVKTVFKKRERKGG